VPIAVVLTGANTHDVKMLDTCIDAIVVDKPEANVNLCADKGYFGAPSIAAIIKQKMIPHIVPRGEEKKKIENIPGYRARRWVVEACHSWFNRFRKLLVRFEKTDLSYLALVSFAAAIIITRKLPDIIYG